MNSQEEKERALRSQPQGGLTSPFLDGEFFEQGSEEEWEPRISTLVSESPFQSAFEQGRTSAIEPEELEEEFVIEAESPDENADLASEHSAELLIDSAPYLQETGEGTDWQANSNSEQKDEAWSDFEHDFETEIEDEEAIVLPEWEADEKPYDPYVLEEGDASTLSEWLMPEPPTEQEGVGPMPRSIQVVAARNVPVTVGEYAFHQGKIKESGKLDANGRAYFSKVDPSQPFLFEVCDRVCAIRVGAFFNPDDPTIQYGGTQFDWTLVRNDKKADKTFWPYYQQEMDTARKNVNPHTVEKFLQHEHITRRPIQIAKPYLAQLSKVQIQATPPRIRVGPFVRYTDHERAVIWMETVTPTMVRVRYKKASGGTELSRYASTVRVGGRHFAAVEIDGLQKDSFYDYTVELAPLPAAGSIPVKQEDFKDVFPKLTSKVAASMRDQLTISSLHKTEWLMFRTLSPKYDKLRFATGSCRWYPGDTKDGKDKKALGPDMFDGLGEWLQANPKEKWPQFLLFVGDQIYADEIGDNHGLMLTFGRFAERIPGPADPAESVRDKLIDGAWAGRFAHRYEPYKYPGEKFVKAVQNGLQKLNDIHARYPDIRGIYREYPEADPREKLKERHRNLKNSRENSGAHSERADEKKAREAVQMLPVVDNLEISVEPFRAFVPHWNAGFGLAYMRSQGDPRANLMGLRYLSHNFLLWSLPDFERQLPTLTDQGGFTVVRKPDGHGHPSAEAGKHAADFAEYAYLYERSWTSSRNVRVLLAQVPTFLMFDDHELTDDWNFDVAWVRMLHNEKDAYGMWPKTLTDGLAAYWMYQGWCNKAPSQWKSADPRVKALTDAQKAGIDALPELRKCIHTACFTPWPPKKPNSPYQFGMSLDWHYRLPFDPPFLVPDCRSRKRLVAADDKIRIIDHDNPVGMPMSQTIDDVQLDWMRKILVDQWRGGSVAFIALSTPLLMQKKVMAFMRMPEIAAGAWAKGIDLASLGAALFDSPKLGMGSDELLRVFRRGKDLEHMIRDKSWRDLWKLADDMRKAGSPVKSLVLVSGDVHHSYSMTAHLPGSGRPKPELLQITCSGLQTTIRKDFKTTLAEELSSLAFDVGKYRAVPGFVSKNGTGAPDLVLYENAVALVDVTMGAEVDVAVTYLAGKDRHLYRYNSGAFYMKNGVPAILDNYRRGDIRQDLRDLVDNRQRGFELGHESEVQTQSSQRQSAHQTGIQEGSLESPFLGELFFTDKVDHVQARTDLMLHTSPFGAHLPLQPTAPDDSDEPAHEDWIPGAAESLFFDEEQSDVDVSAEYEEESASLDRETDSDFVFEAEGGITGADDRREVRDTTIPPYRWICSVSYEKDGKTLDGGTGFLISNRHVLTAGHVIAEAGSGPMAPSIYVYPGRHYGGEPFGKFSAAKTRVSPNLDFGLITLNRPVDQGVLWWGAPNTKTAWWSEALLPAQQLLRTAVPISTAGYPGVKDAYRRRMFEANGSTVPGSFGAIFRHTADTTQGQSGSPIWTVRDGLHILLGIATSYDQMPGQRATWVGVVRRDIERWMAEDAPKAPKVERRIAIEIPYRWICRLEVYDNDLQRVVGYGTGLLISNRHALTAARVIHDFSRDRRRYSIRITPAYEFGKEAFGSTTASKARVSPKFSPETKDGSVDYGLLTLSRPLGSAVFSLIGNTALGSWGNESHGLSTTPADWRGKAAHIAAFSRSSGGGAGYHKLRVSTGAIVGLQRGQILHKASSKLDAPGAPIWIEAGKRRLLVGIVSSVFSKDSGLNWGCHLSQETQNQLMQWVNEDHEQTELEVRDVSQDELEFVLASPDTQAEDWIGATNPEPDPQGEYLEAESKEDFFGDADVG